MKVVMSQTGSIKGSTEKLKRLRDRLKEADGWEVAVGYPANTAGLGEPEAAYDGEASIIEVALANNYGIEVPRRAFMDLAAKQMQKTYKRVMEKLGPKITAGTAKVEKVLDVAGLEAEEDVRKAIMDGGWEPNAPATIKAKGSSRPLVDTMTMHNRVTHTVRRK